MISSFGWIRVPYAMIGKLAPRTLLLLTILIDTRDYDTGYSEISQKELAETLNCSQRQVSRAIAELKKMGYITDVKQVGGKTYHQTIEILPPKKRGY